MAPGVERNGLLKLASPCAWDIWAVFRSRFSSVKFKGIGPFGLEETPLERGPVCPELALGIVGTGYLTGSGSLLDVAPSIDNCVAQNIRRLFIAGALAVSLKETRRAFILWKGSHLSVSKKSQQEKLQMLVHFILTIAWAFIIAVAPLAKFVVPIFISLS